MKLSNESYFSLNFMVRRSRPNKEGEFPILLRITMNGQRVEKARVIDPFGHAGFDPSGKIRLTP